MNRPAAINAMRTYFARPSSLHTKEPQEVRWEDDLPRLPVTKAHNLVQDDDLMYNLYQRVVKMEEAHAMGSS